jgi:hypothetical protein
MQGGLSEARPTAYRRKGRRIKALDARDVADRIVFGHIPIVTLSHLLKRVTPAVTRLEN